MNEITTTRTIEQVKNNNSPAGGGENYPRTIEQVTIEINGLMEQTRRYVLFQAIEVGRRLAEARTMLPHGQWGPWLRDSVSFSQSTAGNLIRVFEEYGACQMNLFGAEANSQTLGNLTYTKALALLALPEDEREEFAAEVGAGSLSTRQLEAEVARWKEERDGLAGEVKRMEKTCKAKEKALDKTVKDYSKAAKDKSKLERELADSKKALAALEKKLEEQPEADTSEELAALNRDLKNEREASSRRIAHLEKQLTAASSQTVAEFRVNFETAQRAVNEMTGCLIQLDDGEMRGKLAGALRALCERTVSLLNY
jgi:hypothetical protein